MSNNTQVNLHALYEITPIKIELDNLGTVFAVLLLLDVLFKICTILVPWP